MVVSRSSYLLNKGSFLVYLLVLLNCLSFGANEDSNVIITSTPNFETDTLSLPVKVEKVSTHGVAKVIAPENGYKTTEVMKRRSNTVVNTLMLVAETGFKTTTVSPKKVTFGEQVHLDIPPDTGFKTTERNIPRTLNMILPDDGFRTTTPRQRLESTQVANAIAFSGFVTTDLRGIYVNYGGGLNRFLTTSFIASSPPPPFSIPFTQKSNLGSLGNISLMNSALSDSLLSSLNPGTTSSTATPMPTAQTSGLTHKKLGALLASILDQYDRRVRPRNDQLRFVTIFSDFVPHSIIEFNTQEQKFSVMGYFKMDWRDDFLTWDPSMYEGAETLRIPVESIWIPKLTIDKVCGT